MHSTLRCLRKLRSPTLGAPEPEIHGLINRMLGKRETGNLLSGRTPRRFGLFMFCVTSFLKTKMAGFPQRNLCKHVENASESKRITLNALNDAAGTLGALWSSKSMRSVIQC